MKKLMVLSLAIVALTGVNAWAEDDVEVVIDSLSNIDAGKAIEVCGKATSPWAPAQLVVTVEHGPASYTTLVSKSGKWCVVVKRWNYSGSVTAEGSVMKRL